MRDRHFRTLIRIMPLLLLLAVPTALHAQLEVRFAGRAAFTRGEANAQITFVIDNKTDQAQGPFQLELYLNDERLSRRPLPRVEAQSKVDVPLPVNTALRVDGYRLEARLLRLNADPLQADTTLRIMRPIPERRLEVILWGVTAASNADEIGFTASERPGDIDDAWARGMYVQHRTAGSKTAMRRQYPNLDRDGKPRGAQLGLHPRVQQDAASRAASLVRTLTHPAWRFMLVHQEERGDSEVSFDDISRKAFRDHAGYDIPAEVRNKRGVDYKRLNNFPQSRIIPDDHPIHRFYKWYWEGGDGWAAMHTASVRAIKERRPDIITIGTPALRIASVYDSWGEVDALWHWTYTHPDPTRIAVSTDSLLTMAHGSNPPKRVVTMTQLFQKRGYVMPSSRGDRPVWDAEDAPFTDADANADYFTITPDQVRGAFWTKIAYPVDMIAYHGWQSISPERPDHYYKFTHPQTPEALKDLLHNVAQPLGPTLIELKDPKPRVGYLQSFASEMFAGRGEYGWPFRSWFSDGYLALAHAGFQPKILFDDTVRNGGLQGLDVLVLVHCDVLTQQVARAIQQFQRSGGIVVGDENLAPGIKPDIVWKSPGDTRNAQRRKANVLEKGEELRQALAGRFEPDLRTSNPEILLRQRQWGGAQYLFAVNDHRKAGKYMGSHGWVMEDGLPSNADLAIRRDAGVVYDLRNSRQVPATASRGWLQFRQNFGPCEGNVYLITDRPIQSVKVQAPATAQAGRAAAIQIRVVDAADQPIEAVIPVKVEMIDTQGRSTDIAGHYAAIGGQLQLAWTPAPNDLPGQYRLRITELASGKIATAQLQLGGTP